MFNDIINELTLLDKVELITCNTKRKETMLTMTYTIVIDGNNVLDDIDTYKKVIAVMEVMREVFTRRNINISYDIKSANFLEEEISNKNNSVIKKLHAAEIIYSKDGYFEELLENSINKTKKRA